MAVVYITIRQFRVLCICLVMDDIVLFGPNRYVLSWLRNMYTSLTLRSAAQIHALQIYYDVRANVTLQMCL